MHSSRMHTDCHYHGDLFKPPCIQTLLPLDVDSLPLDADPLSSGCRPPGHVTCGVCWEATPLDAVHVTCDACWEANPPCEQNDTRF